MATAEGPYQTLSGTIAKVALLRNKATAQIGLFDLKIGSSILDMVAVPGREIATVGDIGWELAVQMLAIGGAIMGATATFERTSEGMDGINLVAPNSPVRIVINGDRTLNISAPNA